MIDLTTTPAISYKKGWYDGKNPRTKRARWTGDTIDGKTHIVELSVSHDSDRKRFSVYLTRLLASTGDYGTIEEYQPFRDIVRLPTVPVGRFSITALDATFANALANVSYYPGLPGVTALLDRAA